MKIELQWLSRWAIYPPYIVERKWNKENVELRKDWVRTKITIVFVTVIITNVDGKRSKKR